MMGNALNEKILLQHKMCTKMNCEVIKTLQLLVTTVMRSSKTVFNSAKVKFDHVPVFYLSISCTYGNKINYLSWKGPTLIIQSKRLTTSGLTKD